MLSFGLLRRFSQESVQSALISIATVSYNSILDLKL